MSKTDDKRDETQKKAESLFYDIIMEQQYWSEICHIKNSLIEPCLSIDDEDPKNAKIIEKFDELDKKFNELLDALEERYEEDRDELYELLNWIKPDDEKNKAFADAVISGVIGGILLSTLFGNEDDDSEDDEEDEE